jgi:hypothetical protein
LTLPFHFKHKVQLLELKKCDYTKIIISKHTILCTWQSVQKNLRSYKEQTKHSLCTLACTTLNGLKTLRKYIMNITQQWFILHLTNQVLSLHQMWDSVCHLLATVYTIWTLIIYQHVKCHVTMESTDVPTKWNEIRLWLNGQFVSWKDTRIYSFRLWKLFA